MKDILVDNNVAKNFCNPLDNEYKKFITWLFHCGELVVTNQLVNEYISATGSSPSATNIVAIIHKLTIDGRLNKVNSDDLKAFRIKPTIFRQLKSNHSDHDLIKAVMISNRKLALSLDKKLRNDINNYPGFQAQAEKRPQDIPYDS